MIGCIVMASGLSVRYGKNKLLEKLGDTEVVLHTARHAKRAHLDVVAVTRSPLVKGLLEGEGIPCVMHEGPLKSDSMHVGLENLSGTCEGFMFLPADQPLVLPETLERLAREFLKRPERVIRLGFGETAGSPVIFPASWRPRLMAYTGERGGMELIRNTGIRCDVVQAGCPWELWDADTPEKMEQLRQVFAGIKG